MWEEQGDCWDHPGQERQRKAAKSGKWEGKGGELGSRRDRDMQPYRTVGGWGSNRKKQMPSLGLGVWSIEHQ